MNDIPFFSIQIRELVNSNNLFDQPQNNSCYLYVLFRKFHNYAAIKYFLIRSECRTKAEFHLLYVQPFNVDAFNFQRV